MKKIKINPRLILSIGISLAIMSICSFVVPGHNNGGKIEDNEIKLSVTSNNPSVPVVFDACLVSDIFDKGRKDLRGVNTPFELVIKSDKVRILLNKTGGNARVTYKVIHKNSSVSASWPISVIIVDPDSMESFGL